MQVLDAAVALLALLSLGLFYAKRGLSAALAPLAAVSTAVLFLALFGICGLLLPGAFLFTALALALGIFTLARAGAKATLAPFRQAGFLFFVLAGVLALVWLGLRQPVFTQWDEFSFWGTAVKMMKLNEGLYTTAPAGWFWTSTEMPALPLLGWYVQFLGDTFAPWKVYFGDSLLLFACMAALVAPFEKKPALSVGLLASGLALPFFFGSPQRVSNLSPAYLSAYGDLPAGVLFGGTMVFYLGLRLQKKNPLWALLPLGALALVKDNTFPLALAAGGMMLADSLLFCPAAERKLPALWRKTAYLAAFLAVPLGAYLLWKQHAAWANAQNVVTGGAATGESAFGAAGKSLAQLVGLQPQSQGFASAKEAMLAAFVDRSYTPVSMLGSGLFTLLAVLAVLALGVLLAPGKRARLRLGLWAGLSAGGFLGFQFVLLTYFAFLNKYGGGLPDYPRYSATYFAGWLLLALFLLAACARERPLAGQAEPPPRSARGLAAQSVFLVLVAGLLALTASTVLPGYSVLDYPNSLYAAQKAEQAAAEKWAADIPPGSRVFYLNPGDDGGGWFRNHYYLYPGILDYSFGGDLNAPRRSGEELAAGPLTAAELQRYLEEKDIRYIYVDGMDETTARRYGGLFAQKLQDYEEGPALYEKLENGLFEAV